MKKYEITIENVALLNEVLQELDKCIDEDVTIENILLKGIDIKPIA